MANIRVDSAITIIDGQEIKFRSPCDCSQVSGLIVYYPDGETTKSKTFQFADAHGNNVGSIDLFASNVLVKVILDIGALRAYVQNADTNAYLEGKFAELEESIENAAPGNLYGTEELTAGTTPLADGVIYCMYEE